MKNTQVAQEILKKFFVQREFYGSYRKSKRGSKATAYTAKEPMTLDKIEKHIQGEGQPIGAHTQSPEGKSILAGLDYDASADAKMAAIDGDSQPMEHEKSKLLSRVMDIKNELSGAEVPALLEDSFGGYHLWVFMSEEISQELAYDFAHSIDQECKEAFPKQRQNSQKTQKKYGNWLRLPGKYHSDEDRYSKIWDESGNWLMATELETWKFIAEFPHARVEKVKEYESRKRKQREEHEKGEKERKKTILMSQKQIKKLPDGSIAELDSLLSGIRMKDVLEARFGMKPTRGGAVSLQIPQRHQPIRLHLHQ